MYSEVWRNDWSQVNQCLSTWPMVPPNYYRSLVNTIKPMAFIRLNRTKIDIIFTQKNGFSSFAWIYLKFFRSSLECMTIFFSILHQIFQFICCNYIWCITFAMDLAEKKVTILTVIMFVQKYYIFEYKQLSAYTVTAFHLTHIWFLLVWILSLKKTICHHSESKIFVHWLGRRSYCWISRILYVKHYEIIVQNIFFINEDWKIR